MALPSFAKKLQRVALYVISFFCLVERSRNVSTKKRMPLQSLTQIVTTMKYLILTGKITAATSFIIGTILVAIYLYFDNPYNIETVGLIFIITAFWINIILWIILLISAFIKPEYRIETLKTCGIMVLNIPIAIGYFFLVLCSLDNTF